MTLLTEKERQLLKESASNMSAHAFQRLKPYERREYWNTLDRAILSIMQLHPDAFNAEAIKDMEDKLKNKQSYARS
jgi:hypothetical protein